MDWSQWLYAFCLALAFAAGRPGVLIWVPMVANFLATILMAGEPLAVGMFDLLCATMLLFAGRQGLILAAFFAAMQPVYLANVFLGLPSNATYAIIDVLAFGQLVVIGGSDGMARLRGSFGHVVRRRADHLHSMEGGGAVGDHRGIFSRSGQG